MLAGQTSHVDSSMFDEDREEGKLVPVYNFRLLRRLYVQIFSESKIEYNMQNAFPTSEKKYREFIEALGHDLDRRYPGVFQWRFGKPTTNVVDGLIITKEDVRGYVFVVGSCRWSCGTQGGVWREGAEHSYSASIMQKREWEQPDVVPRTYLESRCVPTSSEIIDWLVQDWAFERPWCAPLPVDLKAEKKRLQKIVQGLNSSSDLLVSVTARVVSEYNLTPAGQAALNTDLADLELGRIARGFPRDHRGALALKTTVLLGHYETTVPPARDRDLCLVAAGPQKRSDPQEIRITIESLIKVNQDHCWEHDRWRWHAGTADVDRETRWGVAVPAEAIASDALSQSQLAENVRTGCADEGEKAALAIMLQEQGKLIEALELYGIEVDEDLKRLCGGQKIYPPACCAYADEKWVKTFQDWMRACAPWLLANSTRQEAERISARAVEKKGRKRRLPVLKLFIFPGQQHSRKASLVLTSKDLDGLCPRLEIQATASNARLYESAWKRPLEIDFIRYQL